VKRRVDSYDPRFSLEQVAFIRVCVLSVNEKKRLDPSGNDLLAPAPMQGLLVYSPRPNGGKDSPRAQLISPRGFQPFNTTFDFHLPRLPLARRSHLTTASLVKSVAKNTLSARNGGSGGHRLRLREPNFAGEFAMMPNWPESSSTRPILLLARFLRLF